MPKYDMTPAELDTPTLRSARVAWENTRQPPASMRRFAYHGHNVMRIAPGERPPGWLINDIVAGKGIFPGDVNLVPECTVEDGVPDWAIAQAVREVTPCEHLTYFDVVARAKEILKEYRP